MTGKLEWESGYEQCDLCGYYFRREEIKIIAAAKMNCPTFHKTNGGELNDITKRIMIGGRRHADANAALIDYWITEVYSKYQIVIKKPRKFNVENILVDTSGQNFQRLSYVENKLFVITSEGGVKKIDENVVPDYSPGTTTALGFQLCPKCKELVKTPSYFKLDIREIDLESEEGFNATSTGCLGCMIPIIGALLLILVLLI